MYLFQKTGKLAAIYSSLNAHLGKVREHLTATGRDKSWHLRVALLVEFSFIC